MMSAMMLVTSILRLFRPRLSAKITLLELGKGIFVEFPGADNDGFSSERRSRK